MANKEAKRWQDLLIIPLIVGLIVAFVQFGLPKFFEKNTQLSYSIEGPITYIEPKALGKSTVEVNGIPTSYLYAYKVRIWNSGDLPLRNLPIRFVFTVEEDFKIFTVVHDTKPKYEFGGIQEQGSNAHSKRFIYSLLNPKDEDIVTFLTNHSASLSVYAKSEGLSVKWVKPREPTLWHKVGLVFAAVIASVLALLMSFIRGIKYQPKKILYKHRNREENE